MAVGLKIAVETAALWRDMMFTFLLLLAPTYVLYGSLEQGVATKTDSGESVGLIAERARLGFAGFVRVASDNCFFVLIIIGIWPNAFRWLASCSCL